MTELTVEEWNILTYIQRYTQRWQVAPQVTDIRHGCGYLSKDDTSEALRALVDKGVVLRKYTHPGFVRWHVRYTGMVGVEP